MWPLHPDFVKLPPNDEKRKRGYPDLVMFEGDKVVIPQVTHEDQNQLTTWYTEHAVKFIEQNKDRPFFLYLAHNMPHVPLHVSDKFRGKTERGLYGDVIEEIDWSVGQVMDALKRTGLEDKTWVIFTSDNGPWLSYGDHAGSAYPLREGKGTCWEGGTREPCIMRWPGKIPAGTESRQDADDDRPVPDHRQAHSTPSCPSTRSTAWTSGRLSRASAARRTRTRPTGSITRSTSSRRSSAVTAAGSCNCRTPTAPWAGNPADTAARPSLTSSASSSGPSCTTWSTTSPRPRMWPRNIPTSSSASKPKPGRPARNWAIRLTKVKGKGVREPGRVVEQ